MLYLVIKNCMIQSVLQSVLQVWNIFKNLLNFNEISKFISIRLYFTISINANSNFVFFLNGTQERQKSKFQKVLKTLKNCDVKNG